MDNNTNSTNTNTTFVENVDRDKTFDSIMRKLDLLIKSYELAAAAEEARNAD